MKYFCLFIVIFLTGDVVRSQEQLKLNSKNVCRIDTGTTDQELAYTFEASQKYKDLVQKICNTASLQPNFQIKAASILNARATIEIRDSKRYIYYSEVYLADKITSTKTEWAAVFVIAHEIAHHLNGHTLSNSSTMKSDELKADKWAAYILHKMGANLQETMAWAKTCTEMETATHPPRNARLEAITIGWNEASVEKDVIPDNEKLPEHLILSNNLCQGVCAIINKMSIPLTLYEIRVPTYYGATPNLVIQPGSKGITPRISVWPSRNISLENRKDCYEEVADAKFYFSIIENGIQKYSVVPVTVEAGKKIYIEISEKNTSFKKEKP